VVTVFGYWEEIKLHNNEMITQKQRYKTFYSYHDDNNNNNDRLTAFDPGQPG